MFLQTNWELKEKILLILWNEADTVILSITSILFLKCQCYAALDGEASSGLSLCTTTMETYIQYLHMEILRYTRHIKVVKNFLFIF